ncbi:hypothetical protein JCM10213_003695 [Rhodosporidiobolus nylandii]
MFRYPGVDLADLLRSFMGARHYLGGSFPTPEEREWEVLRARQGGTKQLDLFDHHLVGPEGACEVLRAIDKSPAVTHIALSHNALGDDGLRELVVGLKRLRSRDVGAHLEELNLSDCQLTDVSLHLLTLHLLQPSPHPPSLRSLFLNHNALTLGSILTSLPEFLGKTLSSPACALRSLALTSNRNVGPAGFLSLLSHLNLASGPSHFSELRLSGCTLTPAAAEPLAAWLEDPQGGSRLQVLAINACSLGEAGVRRIARAVISGKASSLLHLECLANEDGDVEQYAEASAALRAAEDGLDVSEWKENLEKAKKRNQTVYKETQTAALALLAPARVLLGGNPQPLEPLEPHAFPFLRLPVELQVHILRCSLLLAPSSTAHVFPRLNSSAPPSFALPTSDEPTMSSPLTERQFLRLISFAASRSTLETERRIAAAHAAGAAPSLSGNGASRAAALEADGDERDAGSGWEEWFLRTCGCDRFERAEVL